MYNLVWLDIVHSICATIDGSTNDLLVHLYYLILSQDILVCWCGCGYICWDVRYFKAVSACAMGKLLNRYVSGDAKNGKNIILSWCTTVLVNRCIFFFISNSNKTDAFDEPLINFKHSLVNIMIFCMLCHYPFRCFCKIFSHRSRDRWHSSVCVGLLWVSACCACLSAAAAHYATHKQYARTFSRGHTHCWAKIKLGIIMKSKVGYKISYGIITHY